MYKTSLLTLWFLQLLSKHMPFFSINELKTQNGPWKSLFKTIYVLAEDVATLSIFIENKFMKKQVDFSDIEAQIRPITAKYDKNNDKDFNTVYQRENIQSEQINNYYALLHWMAPKDTYQINLWGLLQNELQARLDAIFYVNDSRKSIVDIPNIFAAPSVVSSTDMDYYFRYSAGSGCGSCGSCCS